jgi:uncharacterized protein YdbL (DUF1318 family)
VADLNVIYKISADISGLQTGVDRAAKSAEGLETIAGRVGTALAGMFTISTLSAFAKQVIGAADSFKKMAQQAGITTEEVQRLSYIAGQSKAWSAPHRTSSSGSATTTRAQPARSRDSGSTRKPSTSSAPTSR